MQLYPLWYSIVSALATVFFVDSHLGLLLLTSPSVLWSGDHSKAVVWGNRKAHLASFTVFHCLTSSILQTIVSYICLFFSCSRWEGKHHVFPGISSWPEVEVISTFFNQRFLMTFLFVILHIHSFKMYGIIVMCHNSAKDIDLILQLNKLSPEMFRHRGREVDFIPTT